MAMQSVSTGTTRQVGGRAGGDPAYRRPLGRRHESGAQHLPVALAEVVAILLADGRHRVIRDLGLSDDDDRGALGCNFEEIGSSYG
jgi:hypothetical protein